MRAILLLLAILVQTPEKAAKIQQIPSGEIATLNATNATEPLTWSIYQLVPVKVYKTDKTLVFTRPPGLYLVWLDAANGNSSWRIQFTAPNGPQPIPNPGPDNPPIPQPIPKPPSPGPQPDPSSGGFIYPEETNGFSSGLSKAIRSSSASADEAAAMSGLYSFIARKIALDGQRPKPGLQTLTQATELVRSEEKALLAGTQLRNLKTAFPEVAKVASAEFSRAMDGQGDVLTPKSRASYVSFLQQLAAAFDRVGPQ